MPEELQGPKPKNEPSSIFSGGTLIAVAILGATLFVGIVGFWIASVADKLPPMSMHGWIALSLGAIFSLAIGGGLMWLSFYSSRNGFDDRADPGRLRPKKDKNTP